MHVPLVCEGVGEEAEGAIPKGMTGEPLISVGHLGASWSQDKDKRVLRDISFEVTLATPFLAVVGPVGAGKVSNTFPAPALTPPQLTPFLLTPPH